MKKYLKSFFFCSMMKWGNHFFLYLVDFLYRNLIQKVGFLQSFRYQKVMNRHPNCWHSNLYWVALFFYAFQFCSIVLQVWNVWIEWVIWCRLQERWRWWKYFKSDSLLLPYSLSNANEFILLLRIAHCWVLSCNVSCYGTKIH